MSTKFPATPGLGGETPAETLERVRSLNTIQSFGFIIPGAEDAGDVGLGDYLNWCLTTRDEKTQITTNQTAIALNTAHAAGDGSDHADVAANTAHAAGDGSDHADVAANTAHAAGDGSDHADVAANTAHAAGDGSDHADVAANTAHAARQKYIWQPNSAFCLDFQEGSGTTPTNHSENATRIALSPTITGSTPPSYDASNQLYGDSCLVCGNSATARDGYVSLGVGHTKFTMGGEQDWEFSCWYKSAAASVNQELLLRDSAGSWVFGSREILVNTSGYLEFMCATAGSSSVAGSTNLRDGNWHKLQVRYYKNAGKISLAVDGAVEAYGSITMESTIAGDTSYLMLCSSAPYYMQGAAYRNL